MPYSIEERTVAVNENEDYKEYLILDSDGSIRAVTFERPLAERIVEMMNGYKA